MKKRTAPITAGTKILVDRLHAQIQSYQDDIESLNLRDRVLRLLEVHQGVKKLGIALAVEDGLSSASARERIKGYLTKHKNEVIDAFELSAISGILDFGRRVRELRDEGYTILTGPSCNPLTGKPLRPDQYFLVA